MLLEVIPPLFWVKGGESSNFEANLDFFKACLSLKALAATSSISFVFFVDKKLGSGCSSFLLSGEKDSEKDLLFWFHIGLPVTGSIFLLTGG